MLILVLIDYALLKAGGAGSRQFRVVGSTQVLKRIRLDSRLGIIVIKKILLLQFKRGRSFPGLELVAHCSSTLPVVPYSYRYSLVEAVKFAVRGF